MTDRSVCFYARILNGKAKLVNRDGFDRLVQSLDGQEIDIIVRRHRKGRSLPQNAYLWGCVYKILADHLEGYTEEDVHEAMGQLFRTDRTGVVPRVKSTTEMSTVEFNEYLERIIQFAAEKLELVIPDPS